MKPHIYEALRLPIDSDIQRKIGGFHEGMQAERDRGLFGVCHDVKMEIGGVIFRILVFVVEGGRMTWFWGGRGKGWFVRNMTIGMTERCG